LNVRFRETFPQRRDAVGDFTDAQDQISLHQHQAGLSRKAVINAKCSERLFLPKAVIQSQCEKN
jgi:hypothetical protein